MSIIMSENNYNSQAESDESNFLTLELDGAEVECEIAGVFDFGGKEYIALMPEGDTDDVFIYEYVELDDENFELRDIEDDIFAQIVAEFDKIIE